jgi:hypothetical protein
MKIRRVATTSASAFGLLALLFTVACGSSNSSTAPSPTPGGGGGGDSTAPKFTDVQSQIFNVYCVGCHTSDGRTPAAGMDLNYPGSYNQLVNAASSGKPGAIRVIPGDADNSYLVQKVQGVAGIVGLRMPRNQPPLSDAQILLIRQWIAAGALNN